MLINAVHVVGSPSTRPCRSRRNCFGLGLHGSGQIVVVAVVQIAVASGCDPVCASKTSSLSRPEMDSRHAFLFYRCCLVPFPLACPLGMHPSASVQSSTIFGTDYPSSARVQLPPPPSIVDRKCRIIEIPPGGRIFLSDTPLFLGLGFLVVTAAGRGCTTSNASGEDLSLLQQA